MIFLTPKTHWGKIEKYHQKVTFNILELNHIDLLEKFVYWDLDQIPSFGLYFSAKANQNLPIWQNIEKSVKQL